jgi:hypothetical protein
MTKTTLEIFTQDLQGRSAASLDPQRLAEAKRRGARLRRRRTALTAVVAAIVVGGSATLLTSELGGGADRERNTVALDVATRPSGLSDLQKQVLREVPGSERISAWQVALPEPPGAKDPMESVSGDFKVQGRTFPTGVPSYTGVTMYDRAAFPGWLYDAALAIEEDAGGADGQPVGSMDMGLAVVNGTLELACISFQGADCAPAVVRREDGQRHYEWGFGTDDFLDAGTGMEVFAGATGAADAPSLAVAGLPNDSVTRVEFVNTAGEIVEGTVDHTMAPGSSIMWASVPGALARVVAYDSGGAVVDDHSLRACTGGVDCEVR